MLFRSVLFLVILGPDLLKIWMGAGFASQTTRVLQILALGVLANGMSYVPYNMLQAVGRPDLTAKFHLFELVPYVLLCLFLIPRWGISGAAAASAFRFSLDFALLLWATGKYCRCSLEKTRYTIAYRILPLTAALGVALALVHYAFSSSGVRLLLGVASLLLYVPCAWVLAVDRSDKPGVNEAMKLFLRQPAT